MIMSQITCYDSDGNALKRLFQWDSGRVITVRGVDTANRITCHFSNRLSKEALIVTPTTVSGGFTVNVPNILLQQAEPLNLYIYETAADEHMTTHVVNIPVMPRTMPSGYEYDEGIDYMDVEGLTNEVNTLRASVENDQAAIYQATSNAEAAATRANTAAALGETSSKAMGQYNGYDVLAQGTRVDGEHNGITFTWNDNECHISGTLTAKSAYKSIYASASALPYMVKPGATLRLKWNISPAWIGVRFHDGSAWGSYIYKSYSTSASSMVNVPANAVGMGVILGVDGAVGDAFDTTAKLALMTDTLANDELSTKIDGVEAKFDGAAFQTRGIVPAGEDIDNYTQEGHYLLSSNSNYKNVPHDQTKGAYLEVFATTSANTLQRITVYVTNEQYIRASINSSFANRSWKLMTPVNNNTYNNTYATEHYENSYTISCAPSITTDTNNYIAAAGDDTDMSGAIQTMLNRTGVCRLGPGRFFIGTGVEVPDYGALIGSGPMTAIVLSDSVTSGYCVKLNSYAAVKDIRLTRPGGGNYSPVSEVGACHGILYEATGDATTGATYEYRSVIDNCWIYGFPGGGITCNNTGISAYHNLVVNNCHIWRCDAGIYIPYRSEYHRFANVSAPVCYYGCVDNSANNNYANCSFSSNTVGLLINNGAGAAYNNAHGTFTGCTFNHSGGDTGAAIRLIGITSGEIFTGTQIFFGAIDIQNCVGVRFIGANFGTQTPISVTGSTLVTFSDSTFISTSTSPYTGSGNTAVKFSECYLRSGAAYSPA